VTDVSGKVQGKAHVPMAERPEATFLPTLVDTFLTLLATVLVPPVTTKPDPEAAIAPVATNGAADGSGDSDDESDSGGDAGAPVATGAGSAVDVVDGGVATGPLRLEVRAHACAPKANMSSVCLRLSL
jgi:hypothetical protein